MIQSAAIVFVSYLIGGIPFGLYIGKWLCNKDIREHGSGNIGASNAWRVLGWKFGLPVFLLDVGKGFAPVFVAHHMSAVGSPIPILAGLGTIMGHNFSPYLGFRGGKGVASTLGVAIALSPIAGGIAFIAWCAVLAVSRYISVSSVAAVPVGGFFIWTTNGHALPYALFAIIASVFVVVKHRSNFARLRAGTEPRFSFSKKEA